MALWLKKTRMMGLGCREERMMLSLAVWIQYTSVTDRWTDGQTDTGRHPVPRLRIVLLSRAVKTKLSNTQSL